MQQRASMTVTLDRLCGVRESAVDAVAHALAGNVSGETVYVDAANTVAATTGFSSELVKQVLVVRDAAQMVVIGGAPGTRRYLTDSAYRQGVRDRLIFRDR